MRFADILRLILLAAIWSGSFIFMRVLAPVLGPVLTADLRVLIAGLALLLYFRLINFDVQWRKYWKQYLIIGSINSALPLFLFSFAALHIPASLSVILNSTSPPTFFGWAPALRECRTNRFAIPLSRVQGIVIAAGVTSP